MMGVWFNHGGLPPWFNPDALTTNQEDVDEL